MWVIKLTINGKTAFYSKMGRWATEKSNATVIHTADKNNYWPHSGMEWEELTEPVFGSDEEESVFA